MSDTMKYALKEKRRAGIWEAEISDDAEKGSVNTTGHNGKKRLS